MWPYLRQSFLHLPRKVPKEIMTSASVLGAYIRRAEQETLRKLSQAKLLSTLHGR
jgi:hypothetical protein